MTSKIDPKALLSKLTLSKQGRHRPVAYKKPRDRLIESLEKQLRIVQLLKDGRNPKEEGFKEHKMFYERNGRYMVQLRYSNTPLELMDDADAAEVETLEQVEEVFNSFIAIAREGYFDAQVNKLAQDWAAQRARKRAPRKPKVVASEQAI